MQTIIVSAKYLYFSAVWRRDSERKNCIMFAKMIGRTIREIAVFGSIKIVNRAIAAAGSPIPKNPLMMPEHKKAARMTGM